MKRSLQEITALATATPDNPGNSSKCLKADTLLRHHWRIHGPAILAAVHEVLKHCALVHKHWGDNCNQKEADAATKALALALDAASNVEVP